MWTLVTDPCKYSTPWTPTTAMYSNVNYTNGIMCVFLTSIRVNLTKWQVSEIQNLGESSLHPVSAPLICDYFLLNKSHTYSPLGLLLMASPHLRSHASTWRSVEALGNFTLKQKKMFLTDHEPLLWNDHLFPPKPWKCYDTKRHEEMLSLLTQKQVISLIHFAT